MVRRPEVSDGEAYTGELGRWPGAVEFYTHFEKKLNGFAYGFVQR